MKKKLIVLLVLAMIFSTFSSFSASATAWADYWTSENPNPPDNYAYSFALVGDTQVLSAYDAGTDGFTGKTGNNYVKNVYKWIVDNKNSKKISYVFGLGDITQTWTGSEAEWNVVKPAIAQLDAANIPYSMIRGNHDDKTMYKNAFNTTSYNSQFLGFYEQGNPANSYRTMTIGNVDYLFVTLDYAPTQAILDWANGVIGSAAYKNHKVIISTHGYMNNNGQRLPADGTQSSTHYVTNGSSSDGTTATGALIGEDLWDKCFKKHSNIFMVLCGHIGWPCPQVTTAKGDNGNTVYQVLVNPQDVDSAVEPTGSVTILYFSADGTTFWVEDYSTVKGKYFNLTLYAPYNQYSYYKNEFVFDEFSYKTNRTASVRLSTVNSGLRFKTLVRQTFIDNLKGEYPNATVSVGTLIAPADKLGETVLDHTFGVSGKDYIDVPAVLDKPFAQDDTFNTYAGSLVNIKEHNLDRDFVGRGYVKVSEAGKADVYYYSDVSSTRSVTLVAASAFADVSDTQYGEYDYLVESSDKFGGKYSPYTETQRTILRALIRSKGTSDSFEYDIF